MHLPSIIAITPFETVNVDFLLCLLNNTKSCYPVLHLGHNTTIAESAIGLLLKKTSKYFGVCITDESFLDLALPQPINTIIYPGNCKLDTSSNPNLIHKTLIPQIICFQEAEYFIAKGINQLIVKGNEASGRVGNDSAFILFQRIKKAFPRVKLWLQGGSGINSAPAVIAGGGNGVVLDSQLAGFAQACPNSDIKNLLPSIDGTETQVIAGHRVLVRPQSPSKESIKNEIDLKPYLLDFDLNKNFIIAGQDLALADQYAKRYRSLTNFLEAMVNNLESRITQASQLQIFNPQSTFAKEYQLAFPVAAGPMTRVSDSPEFLHAVAEAGGLPFFALSLLRTETAKPLLEKTKQLMKGKTWGIGILGFAPKALLDEQQQLIEKIKPDILIIAGGRPSQANFYEKIGIKSFLHVPSPRLLDMYLKEGARRFIFEGRECGGHVGPLSSLVLWQQQIHRLLEFENNNNSLAEVSVFFAGGIHDQRSAAMVAVIAAPLVARGCKVGLLLGTAYLYTPEAVSGGAILEDYQQQAIELTETVLLETAPGHETRCLDTQFVTTFNETKEKLQQEKQDKKHIWQTLEALNVGRLRIASKGVERVADELVAVDQEKRLQEGMYMIGQVASLQNQVTAVTKLHEKVSQGSTEFLQQYVQQQKTDALPSPQAINRPQLPEAIAIVGMDCVFPDAENIDAYWRNIVTGKNSIVEVPEERWNKSVYYAENPSNSHQSPSKWGGFIPEVNFDPIEFGIPPKSVPSIDVAQLLSLQVAKNALLDAGLEAGNFDGENVSVIFGVESGHELAIGYNFRSYFSQIYGDLPDELDKLLPNLTEDSFAGVLANVISGRISNRLNLGGRNYTVDAACASSLTAIENACRELQSGSSDMVIAGGADLHNSIVDYLMFTSTHALSPNGQCRTFDNNADGISLGEGVAAVVLKRLSDAERDGDRIYGVIRGVGGSSDGKSLGLTAPRRLGQIRALERSYAQAGLSPSEVGLIEAHGTGTVVGDRTELSALTDLFIDAGAIPGQTQLGSVKTQIGHTKCAAGMAGLIKAVLSVYHGVKPPTLNLENPNHFYNQSLSPFTFFDQASIWSDSKRVAGVSAFGFGGTNFHTVLSNYQNSPQPPVTLQEWSAELLVFRGESPLAAFDKAQQLKNYLSNQINISLKNIAYSLATETELAIQFVLITRSKEQLQQQLSLISSDQFDQTSFTQVNIEGFYRVKPIEGKVTFLFSGQGSQRLNMARELFVMFPELQELLHENTELIDLVFPSQSFNEAEIKTRKTAITDTRNAQPLLGIVDYGIAKLLKRWGLETQMVAGHSYGEIPALSFAGAIDEKDLVAISQRRAEVSLQAIEDDPGKMVAVNEQKQQLTTLIGEHQVYPVNHNSSQQWVLAGSSDAVDNFVQSCRAKGISVTPIAVACAFHSPLLTKAENYFQQALEDFTLSEPTLPVYSNTTATPYPTSPKAIAKRLAEHLVKPVYFYDELQSIYKDGGRIFVEVGPGKVLTKLARNSLPKDCVCINTEAPEPDCLWQLLTALGQYVSTGRELNWQQYFAGRQVQSIDWQEKPKASNWKLNGYRALPLTGQIPTTGLQSIQHPLSLPTIASNTESKPSLATAASTPATNSIANQEHQVVMNYLENVRTLVESQRDVMLGYLAQGQNQNSNMQTQVAGSNGIDHHPIETPKHPANRTQSQQPIPNQNNKLAATNINSAATVNSTSSINSMIDSDKLVETVIVSIVSNQTGYPEDMLKAELSIDMEADLGVDSIKRMEIVGALKEQLSSYIPDQSSLDEDKLFEQLAAIKTLEGLIQWVNANVKPKQPPSIPTNTNSIPSNTNSIPSENTISQTVNNTSITAETIEDIIVKIVSDQTGYPEDMLKAELGIDMEADLGVDSIKRMEIVGTLRENLSNFVSDQSDLNEDQLFEQLAAIKTLKGLIQWVNDSIAANPMPSASINNHQALVDNTLVELTNPNIEKNTQLTSESITQSIAESIEKTVLKIVSDQTGYPEAMLNAEMNMDIEADLGIDSIKRMEIVGELRQYIADLDHHHDPSLQIDEDKVFESMAQIKTLNGLVDWVNSIFSAQNPGNSTTQNLSKNHFQNSSEIKPQIKTETESKVFRYQKIYKASPLNPIDNSELAGKRFGLVGLEENSIDIVKDYFASQQAEISIINTPENLTNIDGLLYFEQPSDKLHTTASGREKISLFLQYIQALDPQKTSWVFCDLPTILEL